MPCRAQSRVEFYYSVCSVELSSNGPDPNLATSTLYSVQIGGPDSSWLCAMVEQRAPGLRTDK